MQNGGLPADIVVSRIKYALAKDPQTGQQPCPSERQGRIPGPGQTLAAKKPPATERTPTSIEFNGEADEPFIYAHDYALLEKVYSIWPCIDAPPEEQGTIALYSMQEKNLYGSIERPRKDYDLQSAVFVGLPKNCGYNGNEFIRTLAALFSLDTDVDEKIAALERGLGPELAREFKGNAETMGNLTE